MSEVEEESPAVGSAITVVYPEELRTKYEIGKFGRMTMENGEILYHASSLKTWEPATYESSPVDYIEQMEAWARGGKTNLNPEKMVLPSANPVKIKPDNVSSRSYIRSLLLNLHGQTKITLIDPTFGMMTELASIGGGYVAMTQDQGGWYEDVVDFCQKSNGRMQMVALSEIEGVSVLTEEQPKYFPSTPWVRLVANFESENFKKQHGAKVEFSEEGVIMKYTIKNRQVSSALQLKLPTYIFNPITVDSVLQQSQRKYYVQATAKLLWTDQEEPVMRHSPKYVDYIGEWEEIGGKVWFRQGQEVIDVKDRGTYYSRRSRNLPPEGYQWRKMQNFGTHWVTFATVMPREETLVSSHMLRENTHYYVIGGQMEEKIESVAIPEGTAIERQDEVAEDQEILESYPSDDSLVRIRNKERRTALFYGRTTQRYYNRKERKGVAVHVASRLIGRDKVEQVSVCETGQQTYIEVPRSSAQYVLLFPNAQVYAKRMLGTMMSRTQWVKHMNESGWNTKMDDVVRTEEGQMGPIYVMMNARVITSISQVGVTVREMCQMSARMSMKVAISYLERRRDVFLWDQSAKDPTYWQYVMTTRIDLVFEGNYLNDDCLDGQPWKSILSRVVLMNWGNQISYSYVKARIGYFRTVLELNNYSVRVVMGDMPRIVVSRGFH